MSNDNNKRDPEKQGRILTQKQNKKQKK